MNGNGDSTWTRWVLGLLVTVAIFFGGYTSATQNSGGLEQRVSHLEEQDAKGDRWTLQQQLNYMESQALHDAMVSAKLAEINVKLELICKKTNAGC